MSKTYSIPIIASDYHDIPPTHPIHCIICEHYIQRDQFGGACEIHKFWFPNRWDYCSKAKRKESNEEVYE